MQADQRNRITNSQSNHHRRNYGSTHIDRISMHQKSDQKWDTQTFIMKIDGIYSEIHAHEESSDWAEVLVNIITVICFSNLLMITRDKMKSRSADDCSQHTEDRSSWVETCKSSLLLLLLLVLVSSRCFHLQNYFAIRNYCYYYYYY